MYHGAIRDRQDKKRQRVTPPPNEVWMEAIMSKGKTPDGYIPTSSGVTTTMTSSSSSSTISWQEREISQTMMTQQGPMPYSQQYTTDSEGTRTSLSHVQVAMRPVERSTLHQGRVLENTTEHAQGSHMDTTVPCQGRSMTVSGAIGIAARTDKMEDYQGRMMDGFHSYQTRTIQSRTMDGNSMKGDVVYQGRTAEGAAVYQGRAVDGGYQHGRLIQGQPGRVVEDLTGKLYQGRKVDGSSGKMAEDYKRDRKLPPRVEEMLREQVNLDEAVLHDAFAVAMEDLILEREANFIAKGLCHFCGVKEKNYVPVVNFCPHADENHSLCREHLRSVYRVRMEALFVGRNGATPNRRLLRCLVCAHGCPCTECRAEKERKVHKYKCYLLDTLRRSGQGSVSAIRNERATMAVASPVPEGRLIYGNERHRYVQYPPTAPVEDSSSVQREGFPARSRETEHDGHRLVQPQQLEYKKYPESCRNGYGSKLQTPSVQGSSMQAFSMQTCDVQAFSMQTSGLQAQQHSSQYLPVPTEAVKDIPAGFFSVMADGAPVADPRIASRVASPRVRQGSTKLPSAATILNCSESEKSLVQLLSSLNQGGAPSGSVGSDVRSQFSKYSSYSQSESHYSTNDIAAKNGNFHGFHDTEMEAAPLAYPARRIADRRRQTVSPYRDQSYTSSLDSGDDSTPRKRSSFVARSFEGSQALKRKANEIEAEASPEPRNMASRDGLRTSRRSEEQRSGGQRQHQTETRPTLKLNGRGKESTLKPDTNENQSPRTPPPHRGPGRSRKISDDAAATALSTSRAGRKGSQERKTTARTKRGRGRPPKRAKRATNDDKEMAFETNEGENKEEEEAKAGLDSDLDANLDYCEVCQGAGDLVCCDKCPRSFHLKCLHMTENDLPEGDWQCNECKKPSRFDAYAVAVASEKNMLDKCLKIVQCLKSHPFSKQFLSPVENVPMYTRVVKQPMDLSKIENKLKKGVYIVANNAVANGVAELDSTHFANDIRLMWSNCKLFNDDGSGIARAADILSAGFERLYKESIVPLLTA